MPLVRLVAGVFVCALSLRMVFGLIVANTYDYDEFVLLLLARDFAHGAVPYKDFMFFHPPGALVFFRALEPLSSLWWPLARLAEAIVDSITAVLVLLIGIRLFDRRTALLAGLLYAVSPLAMIVGVRVGQDPLLTMLGTAAVACLVRGDRNWYFTVGAGALLALAVWVKFPALYFVPVCILLSPRRAPLVLLSTVVTFCFLLAPFYGNLHAVYAQTVTFQSTRWTMSVDQRIETTLLFWLALNVLSIPALFRPAPAWLRVGFLLAGAFVLAPQTYYHYFVPALPFAALLASRSIVGLRPPAIRLVAAIALGVALVAGIVVRTGGVSPLFITAAHLSDVAPTVHLLDARTTPSGAILGDRFEYAYLAHRPALAHYFWNIGVLVNARYLERRVGAAQAVVMSSGASSGYPPGFVRYLDARYRYVKLPTTTVWLVGRQPTTR